MEVSLHQSLSDNIIARDAAGAIEACVHCGFCLATCPTYLDSRDERDSPRGRIYLVKELLESGSGDDAGQHHLDRCLTCRSCETTCPSGVEYGRIVDAGRELFEEATPRLLGSRVFRTLLRYTVSRRAFVRPVLAAAQRLRWAMPLQLRQKIPARQRPLALPSNAATSAASSRQYARGTTHARKVLMLEGCVQSAATPNTNLALRLILERLGISVQPSPQQVCCGALNAHLAARSAALEQMRRNIDCWWPHIEAGAEAIIGGATGCTSQLNEYGTALAADPAYASKAARVAGMCIDGAQFILQESRDALGPATAGARVAVHVPCSQTHALQQADTVHVLLAERGFVVTQTHDDHLCCGSAGSYSILQPAMSQRLRERKLEALTGDAPDVIASANIGCQLHLASEGGVPVRHWSELVVESLG